MVEKSDAKSGVMAALSIYLKRPVSAEAVEFGILVGDEDTDDFDDFNID